MTIEYCIQNCLAWSPDFIYAGMTYGQECWCDVALNVGPTENVCRRDVPAYCKNACKGDPKQNCGGFWNVNVYRIRPDVALAVEEGSWTLVVLLLVGGGAYVVGGVALGARRKGKPSVKSHPHFDRWLELHSLCQDGISYSRARLGVGGAAVPRQNRSSKTPLLEEDGRSSKSRRRSSSSQRGKKGRDDDGGKKERRGSRGGKEAKEKKKRGKDKAADPEEGEEVIEETEVEKKERLLKEERESGVHSSQQKIKVVGLNS